MKTVNKTDKFVYGLFLLFVITLTNSIFLCQIGYFGALIILLYNYMKTKNNPFEKSGLELPLLLFVIAEILSMVFSVDSAQAAHTLVKRFMIIPVIYVTIYAASDEKKAKRIVKVFLGAAFLTAAVYLGASYEHYVEHLYSLETKGPSTFQYVMTAGGLLSVIAVYFFAFLINEKMSIKKRILIGTAFLIILIALAGSYTRAAWLGAAAGIGLILLVKKQWAIISAGVILIAAYVLLNPKISRIDEYKITPNKLAPERELKTAGRVAQVKCFGDSLFAADYENGLLILKNGKIISHFVTEKPISTIGRWKRNIFYSSTMNKTFYFFSIDSSGIRLLSEFIPGFEPKSLIAVDTSLFVFGVHGELAEVENPENPQKVKWGNLGFDLTSVTMEKNFIAAFSGSEKKLLVLSFDKGNVGKKIFESEADYEQARVSSSDSLLVFWSGTNFTSYLIDRGEIIELNSPDNLAKLKGVEFTSFGFWGLDFNGNLMKVNIAGNKLVIENSYNIKNKISSFWVNGKKLYTGYSHKDRITSIVDPYHSTNVQRLNQWKTGWRIFKSNPIFGIGDIDLNKVYLQYRAPYESETFGHLHNIYVQVLAVLGLFGFVVFLFLIVKIFLLDIKIYKYLKDVSFASSFALGTLGVFTAFLVSGLAEWNFGDQEIATMLWFTVGLNIAFYKINKKKTDA